MWAGNLSLRITLQTLQDSCSVRTLEAEQHALQQAFQLDLIRFSPKSTLLRCPCLASVARRCSLLSAQVLADIGAAVEVAVLRLGPGLASLAVPVT